jgi:para-nitrobenzyl esterase
MLVAARAPEVTVALDSGRVRGSAQTDVMSWKGVPFAAAPVGALRWRAPQPVSKWSGVRDATQYRNDCMQLPFPSDAAPLGTSPAEDCLYANVWRPADSRQRLPVVVWIYGGGFVNGGGSPPTYSGANLARQGIVFVSFNYRVGRFGTFAHPQLTRQAADGGLLGNYGHMDQLAALAWVRCNVAAFGGDPGNVTLVGESAGGASVHTLATSPLARNLFHKAVVMSGGDGGAIVGPLANLAAVEKIGIDFAQAKGIAPDDPQAITKLRALSPEQITDGLNLAALFQPGARTFAGPFVDGKLAVDVAAAYRSGAFNRMPMIIGATDADIGGKTGVMVAGARRVTALIAGLGLPVYAYRFSYVADSIGTPGAAHATDIPFFLANASIKYGEQTTSKDIAVGKTISAYLVNFARTGNPNGAGLPRWPIYQRAADEFMDFSAAGEAVLKKDPWGAEIDAAQVP